MNPVNSEQATDLHRDLEQGFKDKEKLGAVVHPSYSDAEAEGFQV